MTAQSGSSSCRQSVKRHAAATAATSSPSYRALSSKSVEYHLPRPRYQGTFAPGDFPVITARTPGIFSAAIFAFLLSWGNFYITYSLAGSTRTIPTFIFSGIAVGSSPLYPAIATVVFIPGILLVILANRFRLRAASA